jgi:hypothetical protein
MLPVDARPTTRVKAHVNSGSLPTWMVLSEEACGTSVAEMGVEQIVHGTDVPFN